MTRQRDTSAPKWEILPHKDAEALRRLNELLKGKNQMKINELLMKKLWSVPLSELFLYDFKTNVSEHTAVWKSSLMDFFCKISSLLRQCFLWDTRTSEWSILLTYWHQWLASCVQFLEVEIGRPDLENGLLDTSLVRFKFYIWERPKEFIREIDSIWVPIDSKIFTDVLSYIAAFLLDGNETELSRFIHEDRHMEDLEQQEEPPPLMFGL